MRFSAADELFFFLLIAIGNIGIFGPSLEDNSPEGRDQALSLGILTLRHPLSPCFLEIPEEFSSLFILYTI